jgi:hypothetical protein
VNGGEPRRIHGLVVGRKEKEKEKMKEPERAIVGPTNEKVTVSPLVSKKKEGIRLSYNGRL